MTKTTHKAYGMGVISYEKYSDSTVPDDHRGKLFVGLITGLLVMVLLGCGGGGDGGSVSADPVPVSTAGFWSGTVSPVLATSVVILDNGDAWFVFQNTNAVGAVLSTQSMARVSLSSTGANYAGTGSNYDFLSGLASPIGLSGAGTARTALTGSYTLGGITTGLILRYASAYEIAAKQADLTGAWAGSFDAASATVSLSIDAAGALSGNSTTGCTYIGSATPRSGGTAVFDLALAESCPAGALVNLAGIATLNAAKTAVFFAFTSFDKTRGGLFVGQRPAI